MDWLVLALDDSVYDFLVSLDREDIHVERFSSLPDQELMSLVETRPWRELCWTSASCLLNYALKVGSSHEFVGYVDADCFFMHDISELLRGIPTDKNFAIHEHNFSPDRIGWLKSSGRFNVGVIVGRPTIDFVECIARWRMQVLESCELDPLNGKCGDQTYLDEWPLLYRSLHIFQEKGAGLAPWNLNNYSISHTPTGPTVDEEKIYFFHFHGLLLKRVRILGSYYIPASGYDLRYVPIVEIYRPYLKMVLSMAKKFDLNWRLYMASSTFQWFVSNMLRGRLYKIEVD